MGTEGGKSFLFSIDQFVLLIAWLAAVFAILFFEAYELIIWSVVAFIALNLAIGVWVHKFVKPVENSSRRRYLIIQTIFLVVWCPLLFVLISANRQDLLNYWIIVIVVFYIGIGIANWSDVIKNRPKKKRSD